jgi:hypothetical protein
MSVRITDKTVADILRRIAALEKQLTPKQGKRRLTKAQVAMREGVATRTIDRRVAQRGFPPPDVVDGRCYWWEHDLEAHDAERIRMAEEVLPALKAERRKQIAAAREFHRQKPAG